MSVITVFNGIICMEDSVVRETLDRTDSRLITDKKLVAEASKLSGMGESKIAQAFSAKTSVFNKFTHEREKYVSYLRIVLSELIQSDNVIMRGCAGHLLPRTMGNVLRVCLIANHQYRVQEAVRQGGRSEKEAGKIIQEDDKRKFACTEYLFGKTVRKCLKSYSHFCPLFLQTRKPRQLSGNGVLRFTSWHSLG